MNTSFRNVATMAAFIFLALAFTWMLAPGALPSRWGVDLSGATDLLGRRAAALYAGLGVMFLQARNAAPSPARSALLSGAIVACLLLAILGTLELVNGHAKLGILVPVAIEAVLAMAFLYAARTRQSSH